MIHRPTGLYDIQQRLVPRLEVAHKTGTTIVADLRNPAVQVWTHTEGLPEDGTVRVSVAGWRQHFSAERASLQGIRNRAGAIADRLYPELTQAAVDYFASVTAILNGMNTVLALYTTNGVLAQAQLTGGQRQTMADALAAELEA